MVDDLRRLGMTPRGPDGKAGPASARSIPAALIQDLQSLRQRVLERLGALEALARQRTESTTAAGGITALERTLQQRQAELEEARRQVRAEAERQEKEWSASLTQLEADRRLLAEAWERLERQRIDGPGASERHPHTHSQVQRQPRDAPAALLDAAVAPARSAAADSGPDNPIAQAILRQFQALSRDVRCTAEARRDSD